MSQNLGKGLLAQEGNIFPRKCWVPGFPPDTDNCAHPTTTPTFCEHMCSCRMRFSCLYANILSTQSFLLMGASDFIAGPGGEFSSTSPNNETLT